MFLPFLSIHDNWCIPVLVLFLQSHILKNSTLLFSGRTWSHDRLGFHSLLSIFRGNHDLLSHYRTHSHVMHKLQNNGRHENKEDVPSSLLPERSKALTPQSFRQRIDIKRKTFLRWKMVSLVHSNLTSSLTRHISITNGSPPNSLLPNKINKPLLSLTKIPIRNEKII